MGIQPEKIKVTTAMYENIKVFEECPDAEATQSRTANRISDKEAKILFMPVFVLCGGGCQVPFRKGLSKLSFNPARDGPLLPEGKTFIVQT